MKTVCYDGQCFEYEDRNEDVPSVFTLFLVAAVIAFVAATVISNGASLGEALLNIDYINYVNY